jgi:hypothetical protein
VLICVSVSPFLVTSLLGKGPLLAIYRSKLTVFIVDDKLGALTSCNISSSDNGFFLRFFLLWLRTHVHMEEHIC